MPLTLNRREKFFFRALLLPAIVCWVLGMASLPGLWDSVHTAKAFSQHYNFPSTQTKAALQESYRQDRREILVIECGMAVILALLLAGYRRIGRFPGPA